MFRAMPDPFRPPTPQPPRPEGLPPDPWRPPPPVRAARASGSPPPGSPDPPPDSVGPAEPTPGPALDPLDPPPPRTRWWQRPARWEARLGRWLLDRARVRSESQARQLLLVGLAAVALGAVLLLVLGAGGPR